MKSVLEAIAISWRNKFNFGGLVGQLWPLTDQHINIRVVVDAVFGPGATQQLYIYNISNKPRLQGKFNDVRALEAKANQVPPSAAVFCHAVNEWTCSQFEVFYVAGCGFACLGTCNPLLKLSRYVVSSGPGATTAACPPVTISPAG